jgi:hypothetical protein
VNGRDVNEHADALKAFETSSEPILVEVQRSSCLRGTVMSTVVQTEQMDKEAAELDEDDEVEFILNEALDYEV